MSTYEMVKEFAKLENGFPYEIGEEVVFLHISSGNNFEPVMFNGAIMDTYISSGMWKYRISTEDDKVFPDVAAQSVRCAVVSEEQDYLSTRLDVDAQLD